MLSERKAWLKLADEWAKAKKGHEEHDYHHHYYVEIVDADRSYGLCESFLDLYNLGLITHDTRMKMLEKVSKIRIKRGRYYCWSKTKRGAEARVKFCLKQADLLSKRITAK